MRIILPALICLVLLAACAPSVAQVQTAIAQTQTAIPTRTPLPFSNLKLSGQIVQPNDLPPGCTTGQTTLTRSPSHFYDQYSVPNPDYYIGEQIACGIFTEGLVQVFIYEDPAATSSAYQSISAFLNNLFKGGTEKAVSLGDEAFSTESVFGETDLVVRHCHAVITVDQIGNLASMTAYAERLDKRLAPVICK